MKVYLHIGSPKTGTTTLQAFLNNNRNLLLEDGVFYPTSTGATNDFSLVVSAYDRFRNDGLSHFLNVHCDEDLFLLREKITSNLRGELETLDTKKVKSIVFSSEYFHLNLTSQEEVQRVKEILHSAGLHDIYVVVYLRKQVDLASSFYSTSVKAGEIASSPQRPMIDGRYSHLCNHLKTLSRYSSVFGKSKIIPRIFERGEIVNDSIVDDFLHTIGCVPRREFAIPKNKNESLSNDGIDVLCYLNKLFPRWIDGSLNPFRKEILAFVERQYNDSSYRMSDELYGAYEDYYLNVNEQVKTEYFPERISLFNKASPKSSGDCTVEDKELLLSEAKHYANQLIATAVDPIIGQVSKRENIASESVKEDGLIVLAGAVASYQLAEYSRAQRLLEIVVEKKPENVEVLNYLSSCCFYLESYGDALAYYERLLALEPGNKSGWLNKAQCEIELGIFEQASTTLVAARAHFPDYYPLYAKYANMPKECEDWDAVALRWSEVSAIFSAEPAAHYSAAVYFTKAQKHEKAVEYFDKLLDIEPLHEQALLRKAQSLIQLELYDEADLILCKAQSFHPDCLPIAYEYAGLSTKKNDLTEASVRWRAISDRFPKESNILYNAGLNQLNNEEHQEALEYFDRLISLSPQHKVGWLNKALCEIELGMIENADKTLIEARGHCPHFYPLYSVYANIPKRTEDWAETARRWVEVAGIFSAEPAVHYAAAVYLMKAGNNTDAIEYFNSLLALDPVHERGLFFRTQCIAELNREISHTEE